VCSRVCYVDLRRVNIRVDLLRVNICVDLRRVNIRVACRVGVWVYTCVTSICVACPSIVLSYLLFDLSGLYVDKKSWILASKD
jgi:hypothetical protein